MYPRSLPECTFEIYRMQKQLDIMIGSFHHRSGAEVPDLEAAAGEGHHVDPQH